MATLTLATTALASTTVSPMPLATGQVDWQSSYDSLYGTVSTAAGPQTMKLIGIVGVILVVGAIAAWIWQRRSGGGNHSKLLWTLVAGAVCSAPATLGVLLGVADSLTNGALALLP